MIRRRIQMIIVFLGIGLLSCASAASSQKSYPVFNWVFSGMVSNELGERYGYYFEVRRQYQHFHVLSALVDVEKKALIFVDENEATLQDPQPINWQIGRAYLGFNSITNRWSLGVQTENQLGFHFKLDSILAPNKTTLFQKGSPRETLGRLNGHLQLADREEVFVTAKTSLLRQFRHDSTALSFYRGWLTGKKRNATSAQ